MQAGPISLATTLGISVDFCSCSYLDVSVRRVRFVPLCIQSTMTQRVGFPHSDICGSMLVCQLPAAFRRLPRPSSPVIAKASTTCTYSLDPITSMSRYRLSSRVVPYSKTISSIALVILVDTITTQCRVLYVRLINAPRHLYYIPYC